MILPALNREVNTGPQYQDLRQVFYSRIIAEWYKTKHVNRAAFERIIEEKNVDAWQSRDKWSAQDIFARYVKSFNDKEFDVPEESETVSGQYTLKMTKRYIFGGVDFTSVPFKEISREELVKRNPAVNEQLFNALLTPTGQWGDARWIGGTYVGRIAEAAILLDRLRASIQQVKSRDLPMLLRRKI